MSDEIIAATEKFIRVPGLYRAWEVPQLLKHGIVYRIEESGHTEDGTEVFAVYVHEGEKVAS